MRILVLTDGFPPDFMGGFEVSANLISRALAADGFDVTVLSRESKPDLGDVGPNFRVLRVWKERTNRKDFHKYPAKFHGWLEVNARFRNGSWNVPILREHLKTNRYDLVLAFALEKSGVSLTTEAAAHGLPVLWSIGDYYLYERRNLGIFGRLGSLNVATWSRKWIARELSSPFQYVVYNCDNIREHYAKAECVAENTWIVFRSCPVPDSVLPHNASERTNTFLVACQLFPHKGVHIILEAASQVLKEHPKLDWNLEVVGGGDPDYIAKLGNQVDELGLRARVRFLGKLTHEEVLAKMRTCLAFVHAPLWDEPFGRVTMEAIAQGAPLISSDSGAVWEVPTEKCALIYEKQDSKQLAGHIARVLDEPEIRQRLIEAGHARALATFKPEFETAKYRAIIEAILSGKVGQVAPLPMSREVAAQKRPLWNEPQAR